MSDDTNERDHDRAADGPDSLAEASAAGPPIDWDDEDQTPEGPSQTAAADDADPLRSIYGPPPGGQEAG